jgi:small conductance mechanosensitive channel
MRAGFTRFLQGDAHVPFTAPLVRGPVRAARLGVFLMLALVLFFPALKAARFDVRIGLEPDVVLDWLLVSGVHIALIVLLATLAIRGTGIVVRRFEDEAAQAQTAEAIERSRRIRTLGQLAENGVAVGALALAMLMILRRVGVDVVPLLTGAGIAGLAIGFGAQTLVKDVISGFFMILEDQVRVGDVVVINGTGGQVESIRLRTITLRDLAGAVHVFPNGSIVTLANRTKDFSFAVLDVGVGYREDTDAVCEVMRGVGDELRQDPQFEPSILAPLEILGVDAFGDSAVTIKVRLKTVPLKQWEVGRELRRRLKKAFDARGIELPFPQRTLHIVERGDSASGRISS